MEIQKLELMNSACKVASLSGELVLGTDVALFWNT